MGLCTMPMHHAHMPIFDSLVERKRHTARCLVTIPLTQEMGEGTPGSEVQVEGEVPMEVGERWLWRWRRRRSPEALLRTRKTLKTVVLLC